MSVSVLKDECTFSYALDALHVGYKIFRPNWRGYWEMRHSSGEPYIMCVIPNETEFIYSVVNHYDILANDWCIGE